MTTMSSCALEARGSGNQSSSSQDQHETCSSTITTTTTSGIVSGGRVTETGSEAFGRGSSESSSNDDTAPTMQDSSTGKDGVVAVKDVLDMIKFAFILNVSLRHFIFESRHSTVSHC